MIINGQNIPQEEILKADICIVGAGAAGLTLARQFNNTSVSVLLLESGGLKNDLMTQSLADGTSDGEIYPFKESRFRCFGGSTTRWSGICIPLDEGDFEHKSWLTYSGWPFSKSELLPYYQKAEEIFGLPQKTLNLSDKSPFHQSPLKTKILKYSNPLDLGKKYKQEIIESKNISLIIHSNVIELIPHQEGRLIESLKVQGSDGNGFIVKARTVILSTGGMENARLLLASNSYFPQGLGNHNDLVGRFFMEHYFKVAGILPINQKSEFITSFTHRYPFGNTYAQDVFGLSDDLRDREQLLNIHWRICRYNLLEDTQTVITAKKLAKQFSQGDFSQMIQQWQLLWQGDLTVIPRYLWWHFYNRLNPSAHFDHIRFVGLVEQEPDFHNRITLSSKCDFLGQPLVNLTLNFSQKMWESVDRSMSCLSKILSERGFGQLEYDCDRLQHLTFYDKVGYHPMGTTRMHPNPRYGVVDANGKVHDVDNLYIAGSSIFPTGGAANPTFTIVALALRLADHLFQINQ
ncbi:glucose-methanol-choline (GMC) oxidoreductase:NAD binding site [Geminocystis sp. NIES-3708]|uniref:GMC oxidoreductase n=1 Tax=Geminocystis sp. NIES-3708 TaxID=1615909 RepID=UPI0005FCDB40|nr:GMC family oxidoreductase [Geminocystis sp. NIES-3708]BAQ61777.1 glucose-methanol-choline (GMC) oxidoreductase:NAD binding site [Geminocystis sp. NIES-3708]